MLGFFLITGRWNAGKKSCPLRPEGKFKLAGKFVWEKTPFFILTIASSIVTIWAQNKGGSFPTKGYLTFIQHVLNAVISYISYLKKIFRPVDLAVFYPYEYSFLFWQILASCLILIGITILVIYYIKRLPFLFVGWFWYLGTLVPVIGLIQVGSQAIADRYTYLPSIGIVIMLVWGIPLLFPREKIRKKILFPAVIAYLVFLAVLTWEQCGYWKNDIKLFSHAVQVTKNNYLAYKIIGHALLAEEKFGEAIYYYTEAIRIIPVYVEAYDKRGFAYYMLGKFQLAIEDYNEAIRLQPDYANPYIHRGLAYFTQGNNKLGCSDAQKACELGGCIILENAKSKGLCR